MTEYSIQYCGSGQVCVPLFIFFWGLYFRSFDWTNLKLALFPTPNKKTFFFLLVSPLVSVLFLEENRLLITGSTAGQVSDGGTHPCDCLSPGKQFFFRLCGASSMQVWCFSLHDDLKCHLVTKMDLEKLEKRYKGQSGSLSQQTGDPAMQLNSNRAFLVAK